MNTAAAPSPTANAALVAWLGAQRPRRGLVFALVLSLALHGALSLWPAELPTNPDEAPLQATLKEMPPPPLPTPVAAAKPRPKSRRATAPPPPVATPEPAPAPEQEAAPIEPTPEALAMGPEPAAEAVSSAAPTEAANIAPPPELPKKTLPRRVDLVYKAFLGTHGFMIGEATYRFEHAANEYRILTIGEAKGIAALFIRGQGKVESRGIITAEGLQPQEFSVERGSKERRETAVFDWEAGILTLHDQKTEALDLPTFDPLALMWQAYFSPPVEDTQTVSVATTRRMGRYSITREGIELIKWPQGEIETERWHRRSEDGKTDGFVWVAPSLHYIAVKMRITATNRGTLEALLDSIRVDETSGDQ